MRKENLAHFLFAEITATKIWDFVSCDRDPDEGSRVGLIKGQETVASVDNI